MRSHSVHTHSCCGESRGYQQSHGKMPWERGPSQEATLARRRPLPRTMRNPDSGGCAALVYTAPRTPPRRDSRSAHSSEDGGAAYRRSNTATQVRRQQHVVAHPGGGAREIERRGVHITVNVMRPRSRSRSRPPRETAASGMASLIPLMTSGIGQQIAATRGITLGDLAGEEMIMIHAMRRGRLQLPWSGS